MNNKFYFFGIFTVFLQLNNISSKFSDNYYCYARIITLLCEDKFNPLVLPCFYGVFLCEKIILFACILAKNKNPTELIIKDVDTSNLSVKGSGQPVSDSIITAKVEGKIMQNKLFTSNDVKYWGVHVKTKDGIVYLTGNVENQTQKENLVNIATSVNGVQSVDSSDLTVAK